MIDTQARARLGTSLAQLVNGQLTNDEFDEVYYQYYGHADLGVAEIAGFGWSLYSSDVLKSFRLTDANPVDETIRHMADRCFLFLGTQLEFRWPRSVDHTWRWFLINILASCIAAPGYVLGLMALILAVLALNNGSSALWAFLAGALLLLWGISISWLGYRIERHKQEKDLQEYRRAGDWDVWPFISREEYGAAAACRV